MRPLSRSLVVGIVLALVVVLAPAPASASTVPAPPPYTDPVYDLPSTWISEEEAAIRKHEIDLARRADSAKWYTKPVDLKSWRGLGGAAGSAWLAFDIAFQLTSAGIQVAGVIGGDEEYYCQNFAAYEATGLSYLTYIGPLIDCPGDILFVDANGDVPESVSLSYGGYSHTLLGKGIPAGYSYVLECYTVTGTIPAGYDFQRDNGYGWGTFSPPTTGTWDVNQCKLALGFSATTHWSDGGPASGGTTNSHYRIVRQSDGAVVATTSAGGGNPQREARCTYNFNSAPSISSDWVEYTDEDGFPQEEFAAACDSVGAGLTPAQIDDLSSIGVEERTDGGSITEIAESEVPDELSPYKEQMEPGGGTGRKALTLIRTVNGITVDCLTSGNQCANWWADTEEGTVVDQYRCYYGTAEVSLAECSVYRNSFQPGLQTPVITDPQTGEDVQWGGGTQPGNSINPGTGPGTTPGDACMSQWSSAPNPLEWVLHPVKCALVWAFVPRASVESAARADIDAKWRASKLGQLSATVLAVSPALEGINNGDCGGLILPTPQVGAGWSVTTVDRAFLAACPGDFFAPWAPIFFWFITFSILVAGFFAVKMWLDRFVGFGGS